MPSGRFQTRYCGDLVWHNAPMTFRTKREADAYLASVRADIDRGSWIDPDAGKVTLQEYSPRWLAERPQLRPRTRDDRSRASRRVLLATFCGLRLGEIRALRVRHLDLLHRTVRVEEQYQELADGTLVLGPPKTDAGVRTIVIPQVIIPDFERHIASVPLGADGLLLCSRQEIDGSLTIVSPMTR